MQKLFVGLPIALTVACGQMSHPTTASAPKPSALAYDSEGDLSLVARPPVPNEPAKAASVAAPVDEPPMRHGGGPARSLATIGDFVRTRSAQMNFCYQEALTKNPKLAGAISVAVTITSAGDVTQADVTQRSWTGKGTDVLEGCIRARVRTWKFPASDAPTGTYPFSLSFTK